MKKLKQFLLILVLSLSLTAPATAPVLGTVSTVSAATVKKPSLSSQNKRIATINSKGKITARSAGKTTIYAKTGKYTLRCQITVKAKKASRPQVQSSVWISATGRRFPPVAIARILPSALDTAGIEITIIVSTPSRRM